MFFQGLRGIFEPKKNNKKGSPLSRKFLVFSILFLAAFLLLAAWPGLASGQAYYFLRLGRLVTAFLTGSGLALTAYFFQSLTRNPLTSEYTLGVSAASAFFAGLGLVAGFSPAFSGVLGGVGFSFLLFFAAAKRLKSSSLILLGIAFNIFFSSGLIFLNHLTAFKVSQSLSRYVFGGFSFYQIHEILALSLAFVFLAGALFFYAPRLVLISVSEVYEEILGKTFRRPLMVLVLLSGVFISLASAYAGPVPFFALLWANLGRKIFKGNPFKTLFFCATGGGAALAGLDTVSRLLSPVEEIPLGISVALLGLPFLFVLLLKEKP